MVHRDKILCFLVLFCCFFAHTPLQAQQILNLQYGPVVQCGGAVKAAEHLMLIAADDTDTGTACPVQHGGEVHFEPPIAAGKAPRTHKIVPAVLLRDQEGQAIQLVCRAVVEQHILAGGAGIAKAIPDIKAKRLARHGAVAAAPIPCVLVGPHAASPV